MSAAEKPTAARPTGGEAALAASPLLSLRLLAERESANAAAATLGELMADGDGGVMAAAPVVAPPGTLAMWNCSEILMSMRVWVSYAFVDSFIDSFR